MRALNAFLHDIYHRQEILKAGRVPEKLILNNSAFCPEMMGLDPARGIYSHIIGVDLGARSGPMTGMCSRTTFARRRASATCWKTARR